MVIDGQRQHTERMIIVLRDVLGKNNLQIIGRKGFNVPVVGNIVVVIPISELIVQGIPERQEREHTK
jgi:hypothetical protein